jgi:hypothetical protein
MKTLLLIVLAGCAVVGLAPAQNRVSVTFTPAGKDSKFEAAADEYRDIWAKEGSRIIDAMERISALKFREKTIKAYTYEGPSFSGRGKAPMRLRSSYAAATKQATIVHELGHRLMGDLVPAHIDHHSIIFLFVYDVWVDLWGQSFADEQVTFERARSGSIANYDKLWTEAQAMTPAERAGRFKQFVQEHRK